MTRMRALAARAALAAVLGIAAVETLTAAVVYRDRIDETDWQALREGLAAVPEDAPVFLATQWLGPRARMEVPALAEARVVAPPDLWHQQDFYTVGLGNEAWSDELDRDLEGLSRPEAVEQQTLGAFTLTLYRQPQAKVRTWDVLDAAAVEVESGDRRCSRRGAGWNCGEGTVAPRIVEIDYRPRRCLSIDVEDGSRVRLHDARVTTGDELRGHIAFHDFNGRLRSDAPARLSVAIDGEQILDMVVTDEQGWLPFSVETTPGTHAVSIEILVAARGTWDRPGYQPSKPRPACLELRALEARR